MLDVQCPGCGARITFRSGETVYAVCSYCQNAMVRTDVSVESVGKVAVLNDTWSALQLETQGSFDGAGFIVVGRVCLRWERGTWSEWYLAYNDGRTGWMTEAQGFYALSFPADPSITPPPLYSIECRDPVRIDGVQFRIGDVKRATVQFSEGELPFDASPGRESTTVDLEGPNAKFASIEYSGGEVRLFVGSYAEFDSLSFVNLRPIDGW